MRRILLIALVIAFTPIIALSWAQSDLIDPARLAGIYRGSLAGESTTGLILTGTFVFALEEDGSYRTSVSAESLCGRVSATITGTLEPDGSFSFRSSDVRGPVGEGVVFADGTLRGTWRGPYASGTLSATKNN